MKRKITGASWGYWTRVLRQAAGEIIYDKDEIEQLFKKHNMNKNQMPILSRVDNIAKIIRINTGNICKITRNSEKSGENIYYRYCR